MSNIKGISGLKKAHLDYILLAFARTSDPQEVKDGFQKFFETGISGQLLLEVAAENKPTIQLIKESTPFKDKVKDIDIADPVEQLRMLSELHKAALEERVVNVTRSGEPVYKVDLATAARCIELANRVINNEKLYELKVFELTGPKEEQQTPQQIEDNRPKFQIIHKRNATADDN